MNTICHLKPKCIQDTSGAYPLNKPKYTRHETGKAELTILVQVETKPRSIAVTTVTAALPTDSSSSDSNSIISDYPSMTQWQTSKPPVFRPAPPPPPAQQPHLMSSRATFSFYSEQNSPPWCQSTLPSIPYTPHPHFLYAHSCDLKIGVTWGA